MFVKEIRLQQKVVKINVIQDLNISAWMMIVAPRGR
jgi:hypothetical protein